MGANQDGLFDNTPEFWKRIHVVGRYVNTQMHEENNLILEKRRDAVDANREKMVEDRARRELEKQLNMISHYYTLRMGELTISNMDEVLGTFLGKGNKEDFVKNVLYTYKP